MWANENFYNGYIVAAIAKHGNAASLPLVQAIIGVESGFKPTAYRNEPKINDASRGLMQVLYRTALGTGWVGTAQQLMDPETNIGVGVKYLSDLIRRKSGDILAAVSAYNNGHGKRASEPITTCLARDTKTGECIKSFTAMPGQFYNQPYVDKVVGALRYFDGSVPEPSLGSETLTSLVMLGGALWLATRKRS